MLNVQLFTLSRSTVTAIFAWPCFNCIRFKTLRFQNCFPSLDPETCQNGSIPAISILAFYIVNSSY